MSWVARSNRGRLEIDKTPRWFAGVDWGSQKHDVWLADASGKRLGKRTFEHSGEGLAQMCSWLMATSGGGPEDIHVAIKVPHGAVVETLLDRGLKVYAINPKQLDRFRDRLVPPGGLRISERRGGVTGCEISKAGNPTARRMSLDLVR